MSKKIIAVILAIVMLVAVLAACGNSTPAPSGDSTPAPSNNTPADNKDDGKHLPVFAEETRSGFKVEIISKIFLFHKYDL